MPGAALRSCRCQSTIYLRPTLRRQLHGPTLTPQPSAKALLCQTCHPCRSTRPATPATPATLGTSPRARLSSHCLPRSEVRSRTKDSRARAPSFPAPRFPRSFFIRKTEGWQRRERLVLRDARMESDQPSDEWLMALAGAVSPTVEAKAKQALHDVDAAFDEYAALVRLFRLSRPHCPLVVAGPPVRG